VRFHGGIKGFTKRDHSHVLARKPLEPAHLKLILATALNREWSMVLNKADTRYRLLSYFVMRTKSRDVLREYVETGTVGKYVQRYPRQDWKSEGYKNYRRLAMVKRIGEMENEPQGIGDAVRVVSAGARYE